MTANLYQLLGVAPDASADMISSVCDQRLAETSDHNTRVVLRHAKEVLCNPATRTAYDTKLREAAEPIRATAIPPAEALSVDGVRYSRLAASVFVGVVLLGIGWLILKKGKPSQPVATRVASVQIVTEEHRPVPAPAVNAAEQQRPSASNVLTPENLYAAAAPSVLVVESLNPYGRPFATGSGVVIGPERVVTNCHVISRAASVRVKSGSSEYVSSSGTSDTQLDLCQLHVPGLAAPEVKRGSAKYLRVGQTVYAIGAPQGLERTLSQGLVSSLRETPEGQVIQTSAAISPGSSGGDLFDAEGRLIGITTFQTKSGQNLNFAVPVDWLESMTTR